MGERGGGVSRGDSDKLKEERSSTGGKERAVLRRGDGAEGGGQAGEEANQGFRSKVSVKE
jgi:hypothetical protein